MPTSKYLRIAAITVLLMGIGTSVFLFFKGFFDLTTTTYAQEILAAVLGTLMVAGVTVLLLGAQSAAEEARQKSLGVFQEKLSLYKQFLDVLLPRLEDGRLDPTEVQELRSWSIRISLLASDNASLVLSSFVRQSALLGKFRWRDLTEQEKDKWREWDRLENEGEPDPDGEGFLTLGCVVAALREDLGEHRVSSNADFAFLMVDSLVDSMACNRRVRRRAGK